MNSNTTRYTPLGYDEALRRSSSTAPLLTSARSINPFSPIHRAAIAPIATDATAVRTVRGPRTPTSTIAAQVDTPLADEMETFHARRARAAANPAIQAAAVVQRAASGFLEVPLLGYKEELAGALMPGMDADDFEDETFWQLAAGTPGEIVHGLGLLAGGAAVGGVENALAGALGGGRAVTGATQLATGALTGAAFDADSPDERLRNTAIGGAAGGVLGALLPTRVRAGTDLPPPIREVLIRPGVDTQGAGQNWVMSRALAESQTQGTPINSVVERILGEPSPALRSRLAETRVVSENNTPKVVFHGTMRAFGRFQHAGTDQNALFGPGGYHTEDPYVASQYAELKNSDGEGQYADYLASDEAQQLFAKIRELDGPVAKAYEAWKSDGSPRTGPSADEFTHLENLQQELRADLERGFIHYRAVRTAQNVRMTYLDIRNPIYMDATVDPDAIGRVVDSLKHQFGLDMHLPSHIERPKTKEGTLGSYVDYDDVDQIPIESLSNEEVYQLILENLGDLGISAAHAKASIRQALEDAGYDGITHIGGRRIGDHDHRVWISFHDNQHIDIWDRGIPTASRSAQSVTPSGAAAARHAEPQALEDAFEVASREGLDDPTHPGLWRRFFVYEAGMDRFPGLRSHEMPRQYTLADDIYEFTGRAGRAWSRAKARTRSVLVQMAEEGGYVPPAKYAAFRDLFHAWRDLHIAIRIGAKDVTEKHRAFYELKSTAAPEVMHAFQQHRRNVYWAALNEMNSGRSQTLSMFYSKGIASLPERSRDFGQRNERLMFGYGMMAAREKLFDTIVNVNGKGTLDLPLEDQARLASGGEALIDGVPHRLVDVAAWSRHEAVAWERAFGATTDAVAVPSAIVARMRSLGLPETPPGWFTAGTRAGGRHAPPLAFQRGVQDPTRFWKQGTIFHDIARFMVRNVLGDTTAALRSFPGMLLDGGSLKDTVHDLAVRLGGKVRSRIADERETFLETPLAPLLPDTESKGFLEVIARHEAAADLNVHGSEFFSGEMKLGMLETQLPGALPQPLTLRRRLIDTFRSVLTGEPRRGTLGGFREFLEFKDVALREGEGFLRTWAYYHQLKRGRSPEVAAKATRDAFVDYNRFTEFEDEYLRNFALPFYSFLRQTVPNWAKALTGNDVAAITPGERVASAASAWLQVSALPVAAAMWNTRFFGDIEENLSPEKRNQFHIIMGNPMTGEVSRNDAGQPMIFGIDQPADLLPELLGLGSFTNIASSALGVDIDGSPSWLNRALAVEEWRGLSDVSKGVFEGHATQLRRLLNPGVAVPYMWLTGEDLAYGRLVSPDRRIDFSMRQLIPAYRHARRLGAPGVGLSDNSRAFEKAHRVPYDLVDGRFLSVEGVDRNAQMRWKLIAMLQFATDGREDPIVRRVLNLMRDSRESPHAPGPMEEQEIQRIANESSDAATAQQLLRMHARIDSRTRNTTLQGMWDEMRPRQRERFLREATPQDMAALLFFAHGGDKFFED